MVSLCVQVEGTSVIRTGTSPRPLSLSGDAHDVIEGVFIPGFAVPAPPGTSPLPVIRQGNLLLATVRKRVPAGSQVRRLRSERIYRVIPSSYWAQRAFSLLAVS